MSLTLPPRPTIKRLFPHLSEITDGATQQTAQLLWQRVHDIEERLQQAQAANAALIAAHNANATAILAATAAAHNALALAQTPTLTGTAVGGIPSTPPTSPGGTVPTPAFGGPPSALPGGGDGGDAATGFAAAGQTGHDTGGPLTAIRAGQIVGGTYHEISSLTAGPVSLDVRAANQLELLLRMSWHLRLAGFSAGRQKNPSGVISSDKLTVVVNGVLRAYDVFTGPPPTEPIGVHMIEVAPPVMVDDPGTPDS